MIKKYFIFKCAVIYFRDTSVIEYTTTITQNSNQNSNYSNNNFYNNNNNGKNSNSDNNYKTFISLCRSYKHNDFYSSTHRVQIL